MKSTLYYKYLCLISFMVNIPVTFVFWKEKYGRQPSGKNHQRGGFVRKYIRKLLHRMIFIFCFLNALEIINCMIITHSIAKCYTKQNLTRLKARFFFVH